MIEGEIQGDKGIKRQRHKEREAKSKRRDALGLSTLSSVPWKVSEQ